ncbi:MAG TPA: DUF1353 domain-containing protein [Brevundimonas sp.]|jgi:hypothetical protein
MIAIVRAFLVLVVVAMAASANARDKSPYPPQPTLMDRQDLRRTHDGRPVYVLNTDFHYCSREYGLVVTVPSTFVTDLISIPKLARWIKTADSPGYQAAIVHDWLYASGNGSEAERRQADYIFYEALVDYDVDPMVRLAMHQMVRKFGKDGYGLKGDWLFADVRLHKAAPEALGRTVAPAMTPDASCSAFQNAVESGEDYLARIRPATVGGSRPQ